MEFCLCMENKPDGGRVFAAASVHGKQVGISRRDWLAGMAMQAIISRTDTKMELPELVSKIAYIHADHIIAEGEK